MAPVNHLTKHSLLQLLFRYNNSQVDMSIISRLFLKIMVALFGRPDHDIIFDTDDEYDIPHTPNKDVQSYLDYPSKLPGAQPFQ
ncbi:hypothetical protein TMSI_55400 (plasmid) [Klebsiella quasipneumoniae]|uniref:Uncharacterized protein n=1 Tax=Klebsiella pneumoniae TaxID=573 RepID=A0A6J4DJP1_KLEPN|nr:hypothetical protein [Klebsiella quasipneumoniae]BBK15148.1 hypothetical protein TMSI_55400 [Klebsiella quasipneumoniae]BCG06714.1 hypothetical protein [Klebsiella pneumoniae]